MVKFCQEVKREIINAPEKSECCQNAELCSVFNFITQKKIGDHKFKVSHQNLGLLDKFKAILHNKIEFEIFSDGEHYILEFSEKSYEQLKNFVSGCKFANKCCKRTYLQTEFLCFGYVSEPEKLYQLEFHQNDIKSADFLKKMLSNFGFDAMVRKDKPVVYIQDSNQISDFLKLLGAYDSLIKFENIRILKEIRNDVNRTVNFETANLNRTIKAAVKQIDDIEFVLQAVGENNLPKNLVDIAKIRLNNPEANLIELGEMMSPKITKSAVSYRLKQISKIAEKFRE